MTRLEWRTAGESHGPALIGIVDGMPAGLPLDPTLIDAELKRRQGGYGRGGRMKIETDHIEFLSGIKAGQTIGSPIAYRIQNRDATLERLPIPGNARPGHADLAGCQKYGHRDPRAILERASARETAARVAAGGIARALLSAFGVEVFAYVCALGEVQLSPELWSSAGDKRHELRRQSIFYTLDPAQDSALQQVVDSARASQDSLGGVFEVRASGLAPGLGGYAQASERLTARLGAALFSIPAIKGVEFGLGFAAARLPGSAVHDAILLRTPEQPGLGRYARASNRAGGLEGGMTNGEEIVVRAAMKPIPSLRRGLPTVEFESGESVLATYQRSDVTSVPAASVVGEAVVALTLAQALLEKFGGDSLQQVQAAHAEYCRSLELL